MARLRTCKLCRVKKSIDDFYRRPAPNGIMYWRWECKSCYQKSRAGYYADYRSENISRILPRVREYGRNRRWELRDIVHDAYGRMCVCCGETTDEFLTIDHINGDGKEQRGKMNTVQHLSWIIKQGFPYDLQLLCFNCNCAKGFFGECPHKRVFQKETV